MIYCIHNLSDQTLWLHDRTDILKEVFTLKKKIIAGLLSLSLLFGAAEVVPGCITVPGADIKASASEELTAEEHSAIQTEYKMSTCTVKLKYVQHVYTGKALKPIVTVKNRYGEELARERDYTVYYNNNQNCGKAYVVVKGKGNYTGAKTSFFMIIPTKVTIKRLTSTKTRQIKLNWKKPGGKVSGYIMQTALDKNFSKGVKTFQIKRGTTTSKSVPNLKKGTRYFTRVRAYKTVEGKNYRGAWSEVNSIRCS